MEPSKSTRKHAGISKEDPESLLPEGQKGDGFEDEYIGEGEGALPKGGPGAKIESPSFFAVLLNILFIILALFLPLLMGFFTVAPQEHGLVVLLGKLVSVKRKPGIYWSLPFGRTIIRIPTSTQTLDIKKSTVVDKNGNPIVVAGVVTFVLVDTLRAAFDVINYTHYLERQSLAALKRVCSMYPYEAKDGKSLQSEATEVSERMVAFLQSRADVAGAKIVSYELADLQYAPEIASGMLVRQQAQALVAARRTIVEGAVGIVTTAIDQLSEKGIKLGDREQSRLISNLLAVICSDTHVQPVFSLSDKEDSTEHSDQFRQQMLSTLQQINYNTRPKS